MEAFAKQYSIMEQRKTNKELLGKGVQRMAISLLCMFVGPVIIHSSFKNQDHDLYIPILILGLCVAGTAIFMGFKGIKTLMDAFFGRKKKN